MRHFLYLIDMNANWAINEETVEIYRTLYYDHFKPLLKEFETEESKDFQDKFSFFLKKYNWSWDQFQDYRSIDRMQRLVFDYSHELVKLGIRVEPMTSRPEFRSYDPNYGALRLKCPIRSQDPDKYNS
jgi:hypothetical protein